MNLEKQKILIIDDDETIREQFYWSLKDDYRVILTDNAEQAQLLIKEESPAVILQDLTLTENGKAEDGLALFEKIQLLTQTAKIIIMTGNDKKELAIQAVELGAYDFYKKPIDLDEIKIIIKRALQIRNLEMEVGRSADAYSDYSNYEIIGKCPQLLEAYDIIERTSPTDTTILITGESGTGKELVARAIHQQSLRKDNPCIIINCGAIPENLLEAELFGHEKGAYTGAHIARKGKFELADKGTIFLDEIGELAPGLQVKLLRFLQEREIERIGGREPIKLDVRIIAATNRNLEDELIKETFRADLYYRISVITIQLPPLRDRGKDLMLLAEHFLHTFQKDYKKQIRGFSPVAKSLIEDYPWPGNIRELQNKIKRAVIMAKQAIILPEDLNLSNPQAIEKRSLKNKVAGYETECIKESLFRNAGNISRTAKELSVNRTTFYDMLHKYNIDHTKYIRKIKKTG